MFNALKFFLLALLPWLLLLGVVPLWTLVLLYQDTVLAFCNQVHRGYIVVINIHINVIVLTRLLHLQNIYFYYLLVAVPLSAVSILALAFTIILLKWCFVWRWTATNVQINSMAYVRKWMYVVM